MYSDKQIVESVPVVLSVTGIKKVVSRCDEAEDCSGCPYHANKKSCIFNLCPIDWEVKDV